MPDPVLHVIAGPNGAGKSEFYDQVISATIPLEYVNADQIAARLWPDDAAAMSYDAARHAAQRRAELIEQRASFVTETVFSHASKLELVEQAVSADYLVTIHVILVPEELAVRRVASRVTHGGHVVPEARIRGRYRRLWPLLASAIALANDATVYDNTNARRPFRVVARFDRGRPLGTPDWPPWTPKPLRTARR